ncbi:MAG: helix-turn-helix domain-containing protein [Pseudonocardiaceae bacterium]
MSSSDEMKRVITHAADQLHLAIDVEATEIYHRGRTIAAMALAEGMLLLLASYLEVTDRQDNAPPAIRSDVGQVPTVRRMGELIGLALKDDRITQSRFAATVGVSEKHLSQVINGRAAAHPDTLDEWAKALKRCYSVDLTTSAGGVS